MIVGEENVFCNKHNHIIIYQQQLFAPNILRMPAKPATSRKPIRIKLGRLLAD